MEAYSVVLINKNYYYNFKYKDKEIKICVPKRLVPDNQLEERIKYIDNQKLYWKGRIDSYDPSICRTSNRQKLINEKKSMKRGDGKRRMDMLNEEIIQDNYRINKEIYNIKCRYGNVKRSITGKYYIIYQNKYYELINKGGEYVRHGDILTDRLQMKRDKIGDFEDQETVCILNEFDLNGWKKNGKFGFSGLTGLKPPMKEISIEEFRPFVCEDVSDKETLNRYRKIFTDAYDVRPFLRECLKYNISGLSSDLWMDYCYVCLQIYLGIRAGDGSASLVAPMFPVPEEVAKMMTKFDPIFLENSRLGIHFSPNFFLCQGNRYLAYEPGYVNSYVKVEHVGYADSFDELCTERDSKIKLEEFESYYPKALLKFIEDNHASMNLFKMGFASAAALLLPQFKNKTKFIPLGTFTRKEKHIKYLYISFYDNELEFEESDNMLESSYHEKIMVVPTTKVFEEGSKFKEIEKILRIQEEFNIKDSDLRCIKIDSMEVMTAIGFTPG